MVSEVFHGGFPVGRYIDQGMEGSLLYHMAMVDKMAAEPRLILQELRVEAPDVEKQLWRFFNDFASDAAELTKGLMLQEVDSRDAIKKTDLEAKEKLSLLKDLNERAENIRSMLEKEKSESESEIRDLFLDWVKHIIDFRLRQEYETIRGFLILAELCKETGMEKLTKSFVRVQERFGEETVNAAINVSLKAGKKRENWEGIMLSDHFLERGMDMRKFEGFIRFLNCPIFGSHRYIVNNLAGARANTQNAVSSLFCQYFCVAHAKAMLENVLPFAFELSQPKRMATDGNCEFLLKIGHAQSGRATAQFIPLVMSWNLTFRCNLKCSHCYMNASEKQSLEELSTDAGKMLIHQIAEVSRPLLILSGGEPLLRNDIFELIQYGTERGLRMALGSNGMFLDDEVAKRLKKAGTKTVSISLDSSVPERHDEFRGVKGSWEHAVEAIKALGRTGILLQVNTTVTKQNYDEIDDIMALAEGLGVENFHLFFLVPTGRGVKIEDITPEMYEEMIKNCFAKAAKHKLNVKPSDAPQFMRIAKSMGLDMRRWVRGCMAGLYYCRIYPTGDVTPCPYLPIKLGNIRECSFKDIWFNSEILQNLRDFSKLKGKCGICEYRDICGGCRARAYGLTSDFMNTCGDLHEPKELKGDYLAEEPWCTYQPRALSHVDHSSQ